MQLGVNIDHVATLRQARKIDIPDPVLAAKMSLAAGCDSIVCHLRQDRRHINDDDLIRLRQTIKNKLNLEMSCANEIVSIALEIKPDQATLVPERREELTTEGGLDVVENENIVRATVKKLTAAKIKVSLFIDPDKLQIRAAKNAGVGYIELHTGEYANTKTLAEKRTELTRLREGVEFAQELGLTVFAGHGLNYNNVGEIAKIKGIEELNIGHSIIAQAVLFGLKDAVSQMLDLIR